MGELCNGSVLNQSGCPRRISDGRSYTDVMADGLADVARRLNNLAARGIL